MCSLSALLVPPLGLVSFTWPKKLLLVPYLSSVPKATGLSPPPTAPFKVSNSIVSPVLLDVMLGSFIVFLNHCGKALRPQSPTVAGSCIQLPALLPDEGVDGSYGKWL